MTLLNAWRRMAASCIVLGLLRMCSDVSAAEDHDSPLATEQTTVRNVLARVTPAVVAVKFIDRYDSSGVIVSENGLVLTHGHHVSPVLHEDNQVVRNHEVSVLLSDGRTASARLLATHSSDGFDYSLLRITAEGKWPCVEVTRGGDPQPGDWCLHVGHPLGHQPGRPPVPRLGRVVMTNDVAIASSCMCVSGDSGGPLFDREGGVIGITIGMAGLRCHYASLHLRTAILRGDLLDLESRQRERIFAVNTAKIPRVAPSPLFQEVIRNVRDVTVEVRGDGVPLSLGTIVGRDGWVLTKRSELVGKLMCQLADGRVVAARVAAESRDFDVALLKLEADAVAEPPWTHEDRSDVGTIAATVGMSPDPIAVGIIGDSRDQHVPANRGFLTINVQGTQGGLQVTKFKWCDLPCVLPYFRPDVQAGDLLLSVDGTELKDVPEYDDFWNRRAPTAGEPISLVIRRQGQMLTTRAQCPPNGYDLFYELDAARELSPRRSDFPVVIVHDGVLTREQCGSPVVDVSGKIIGINIARAGRHATYAIPTRTVLALIQRLRTPCPAPLRCGTSTEPCQKSRAPPAV